MRTSGRSSILFVPITLIAIAQPIHAQLRDTTPGYPIRDAAVVSSCASCHAQDSTGRMTRISYLRKTPEGWESSIRRMVTLNNAKLEPEAARTVLKYLANEQGLAPEEARPARFESERRMIDYAYPGDRGTEDTCRACHSMGRVLSQRRTRDEWGLLVAMHRGFYPGVDNQGFRRGGGPPAAGGDATHPMDAAIRHLTTAFPLTTPDWTAWSATMRPPRIEGSWLVSGHEPGRGAFFGKVTIARAGAADEFTTQATYTFANGGAKVTRSGRAVVYTGYQWRGRSSEAGKPAQWREVLMVEPGWSSMVGRWFTGEYDEFGQDVTLTRASADIAVIGTYPRALRRGAGQEIRLYGANLPANLAPASIDFGPGVQVERVVSASPDLLTLSVNVDGSATYGARDLFLSGASLRKAVVVYDTVSRIKVTPLAGMARVGGVAFPKQFQQFEAIAYHDGVDGRPDTPDDLELGPVSVTWSVEEYGATYDDDDTKFVGLLDKNGFFTPAEDGPNAKRSGNRNNIGDVWIVATHQPAKTGARPLKGRAHLVVTVPLYMRWEPWRIEK